MGEVQREPERQGVAGNTYVVYCSDNGRPFPRRKTYLYNAGIKTPLLVTGPGVTAGRTDSLVSTVDLAATFLELAGVEKPASVQGVSLAPVLADPTATVRDVAFAERNWHVYRNHARAVRTGEWLYVRNAWPDRHAVAGESSWFKFPAVRELWAAAERDELGPAQALLTKNPQPAEMLFHVPTDPHQFEDLAGDPARAATLDRMRGLLEDWAEATGDSVPADPTPDRQPLHEGGKNRGFQHAELPGAANDAASIDRPGPVLLGEGGR